MRLGLVALVASMGLGASAAAADTAPPANDAVTSPTVVTQAGLPFSASQDSLTATVDTGGIADPAPACAGGPTGYSVWYRFTPNTNLTARVEVTGGDEFPPAVNVYQGRVGHLTAHGCVQSGTSQSLWLRGGTTYYFMLTSYTSRPTFTFTITP